MQRPTHAYIGICRGCGVTVASRAETRDTREWRKDTGQGVAQMIFEDLIIERVPLESARLGNCACPKTEQTTLEL